MAVLTIQPAPTAGKDAYIWEYNPTTNYANAVDVVVCTHSSDIREATVIEFDASALVGATIGSAVLSLYHYDDFLGNGSQVVACAEMLRTDWVEAEATWNVYKTGSNWGTAGCMGAADREVTSPAKVTATLPAFDVAAWVDWTITAIVAHCVASHGGIVRLTLYANAPDTNGGYRAFYSSDYTADTTQRPKLVINYTPTLTVASAAATSVGSTTARMNGNVTEDGAQTVDEKGFVWDLASHTAPGNVAPYSTGYANNPHTHGSWPTPAEGAFYEDVTGMPSLDRIYFRAYAHISGFYAYGDELYLDTSATHRISNLGIGGVKVGGVKVQNAKVLFYDLITETLSGSELTDADGLYGHDEYSVDQVQPRYVVFCVHDVKASLTTAQGSHKDLVFTAKATDVTHWYPGEAGNTITIHYHHTGSLSVSVTDAAITVNINAGTTTAAQIKAAIEAETTDANKMVSVALVAGQNGSGAPVAMDATALAGGLYYTAISHNFITPAEI
jgi:hypothetical protein